MSTPPLDAPTAIRRARRGAWAARGVRFSLFLGGALGVTLMRGQLLPVGLGLLAGTIFIGVTTATRSARGQQGLMRATALIDAGHFAEADRLLGVALRRFSIVRRHRWQALRLLAVARAGEGRDADARLLALEALRPGRQPKVQRDGLWLLVAAGALADADLPAAHAALSALVPPMTLADSLKSLELQTEYCVRVGAWPHVTTELPQKIELAELMPAETAASVQAMFALAARKLGQPAWGDWLVRRATLLADPAALVRRRPVLKEVFAPAL